MAENALLNETENDEFSQADFEAEAVHYDPESFKRRINRDGKIRNEIRQIIADCQPQIETKYEPSSQPPYPNVTIFYRYFFTKHVANLQEKEARSGRLTKYASIFPFKVKLSLDKWTCPNLNHIINDDKFFDEIKKFLVDHTECSNFKNLIDVFVANIINFKHDQHFDSLSYVRLKQIAEIGKNENSWRKQKDRLHLSDYLEKFPRLNVEGVSWYRNFQYKYNALCQYKGEISKMLPKKADDYFLNLPEINCCELLLLLESDYYNDYKESYIDLFKKYIFFFWHASEISSDHEVFFIDDTLFACLKWYKRYKSSKEDVLSLQWELWMMTLVHCRKFPLLNVSFKPVVDENNLKNLMNYANKIDGIRSAVIYYEEPKYPLRFKTFLLVEDTIFWIYYKSVKKNFDNTGVIIKSALLSKDIKKLVVHHAASGADIIYDISSKKNIIRKFMHKYHEKSVKIENAHHCIGDMNYYFEKRADQ